MQIPTISNTLTDWQVIVSADRGLYADWIFKELCALNWHPFLRINHQGTYQIPSEQKWRRLDSVVPQTGMNFSDSVICFKSNPLHSTLLARWDEGQEKELDEVKSKSEKKKNHCHLSVFLRGLINIIADLLCGKAIALQGLFPQSSAIFNTS